MKKTALLVALVLGLFVLSSCASGAKDSGGSGEADVALVKALEACNQDEVAGGSMVTIAALAAEAAAMDPRWRPLSDYASSLKAAHALALKIQEEAREASESEIQLLTQAKLDGEKLLTECEAVRALAKSSSSSALNSP